MTNDVPAPVSSDPNWWRQAAIYQIYPRSFADSNGDGIGDLPGITSRVPYLSTLGVDAVWLSPFYPSDLADGGYDVADYRNVDPKIGTLEQFDEMVAALHGAGIKVIVDIVPNHTSNLHEWFQQALAAAPGSPERDRYTFRDGVGPDRTEPPSDWHSFFGGSAWEPVGDGQFYLHQFAVEQPDLNWDNPEVRADFLKTLRFWSDRGVDGFRVDVADLLVRDLSEPLPSEAELRTEPNDGTSRWHGRPELNEIYAQWREVFDEYDPPRVAVAEAMLSPEYRRNNEWPKSLGQVFNFDLMWQPYSAESFRSRIEPNLEVAAEAGSSSTWVLSNHDVVRHATRYAMEPSGKGPQEDARIWKLTNGAEPATNPELGLRKARAAITLLLALPGSTYMYQGEELGLPEVLEIPDEARQDPTFFRNQGVDPGRDGCRVPIPWEADAPSFGFGSGGSAASHLPQPGWFADFAADRQDGIEESALELYRSALALRRQLQGPEEIVWLDSPAGVLAFERPGGWVCVSNFDADPVELPEGELLLASAPLTDGKLPAATTAWLRRS
ncbi:MAG: glycoside hydrolase family 13 protein [Ancrocorticia sp.]